MTNEGYLKFSDLISILPVFFFSNKADIFCTGWPHGGATFHQIRRLIKSQFVISLPDSRLSTIKSSTQTTKDPALVTESPRRHCWILVFRTTGLRMLHTGKACKLWWDLIWACAEQQVQNRKPHMCRSICYTASSSLPLTCLDWQHPLQMCK